MFEKLRRAFSELSKNLGQKDLSQDQIESICDEMLLSMIESDIAEEISLKIVEQVKQELSTVSFENKNYQDKANSILMLLLTNIFASAKKRNILQEILEKKKSKSGPYVVVFLGINGTGKTTTVAKFASLVRKKELSVLMAAADTHRPGAIEQLTHHGNNLGIKTISQRYGADPSAVARDAVDHAKKNYIDTVLIDTAGRIQTSKNLMEEISKIMRVIKPDLSIFVGDSLSGNDTVNQAKEFFEYTRFDGTILTKSDADAKGGAAISITKLTSKPIFFIGTGQNYENLVEFDSDKFLGSLMKKSKENNEQGKFEGGNIISDNISSKKYDAILATNVDTSSDSSGLNTETRITRPIENRNIQNVTSGSQDNSSGTELLRSTSNNSDEKKVGKKRGVFDKFITKARLQKVPPKFEIDKTNGEEIVKKSNEKKAADDENVVYLSDEDIADLNE